MALDFADGRSGPYDLVAVATIAAPATLDHLAGMLRSSSAEIEETGEAEVEIGGRSFRIRETLVKDLDGVNMRESISNLGRALMVLHSPVDRTVGIEHATEIFDAAQHPKSFVSLDTADHLLNDAGDARFAGGIIASWVTRYIDASHDVG